MAVEEEVEPAWSAVSGTISYDDQIRMSATIPSRHRVPHRSDSQGPRSPTDQSKHLPFLCRWHWTRGLLFQKLRNTQGEYAASQAVEEVYTVELITVRGGGGCYNNTSRSSSPPILSNSPIPTESDRRGGWLDQPDDAK